MVSATNGEGIRALIDEISLSLQKNKKIITACVPIINGAIQALIHQKGQVLETKSNDEFTWLTVRLQDSDIARISTQKDVIIYHH